MVDAYRDAGAVERDVAGRRALELGDEDGLALEDGERPAIGAAVEAREAEEKRLVLFAERSDLSLAVGHGAPR